MITGTKTLGWNGRHALVAFLLHVLLVFPLTVTAAALTFVMDGPKVAREGDLIEYRLKVVNDGAVDIAGVEVLEKLPVEVDFVDANASSRSNYDPLTGLWTLPVLGTGEKDRTAKLTLQVLVHPNLLDSPDNGLEIVNRAVVTAPRLDEPIRKKTATTIVCAFCNDWEIISVELDFRDDFDLYEEPEVRYIQFVRVANNGPVSSRATVRAVYFDVIGAGIGTVKLKPELPVRVSLDAGKTQTLKFWSTWEDWPDSNHRVSSKFEIRDVSLLDPIPPNSMTTDWKVTMSGDSSDGGSGGCTLSTGRGMDPVWLLLLFLPVIRFLRRQRIARIGG